MKRNDPIQFDTNNWEVFQNMQGAPERGKEAGHHLESEEAHFPHQITLFLLKHPNTQ